MVPVAWLWMMVAATGLERLTVNVFEARAGGLGVHRDRDGLLALTHVEDERVGGTAT